ncbi:MAG TPA: TraB/GumN family protein [Candidatus Thermoplasmatota archaeon]|nr:TraB/GumN family protein [Candidatus Thermoplasmatota archaeon]
MTLIGSGHVFQVRDSIRQAILALRPDIVFVELDRGRLHALLERQKAAQAVREASRAGNAPRAPETSPPPDAGFVQKRLQRFQEGVAGMYGADVGEEMLAAVHAGQEVGARIALIDPPADDTVRRVLKQLTWRERLRAGGLLVGGTVSGLFRRGRKADIEAEIRRYQEDPAAALEELRAKFPTLHRIVIAERDAIMARRIAKHLAGARHGVAVVGDGHVPGLVALLGDLRPTVYRLADVRGGRLPRPPASLAMGSTTDVRFGFDARS